MNNESGDKTGMVMQWKGMADSLENFDYSEPPTDDQIEDFPNSTNTLKRQGRVNTLLDINAMNIRTTMTNRMLISG